MAAPTAAAVRRIRPVVPPLDAECVPAEARARAHDALAALTRATATHLGNPDLFHRPRVRTRLHLRHLGRLFRILSAEPAASGAVPGKAEERSVYWTYSGAPTTRPGAVPGVAGPARSERDGLDPAAPAPLAERIAGAAETRTAAGLLAVASVRDELRERAGRRPCFTPDSLAGLHRMLVAGDPDIPGPGGFRRAPARVTWPDGRCFAITVAPGRALHGHVERWYRWTVRTASPAPPTPACATHWSTRDC